MSGEGAEKYLAGTNRVGSDENQCRRAPTAYPYLAAEHLQRRLEFYACSGARTGDVLLREQPEDIAGQMRDSPSDVTGALVQLEYLRRSPNDVDVVLVSIGGNDARFSEIARGCFLPGSCAELRELWLSNVETIGPSVRAVYRQIKEIVGDDVPIVAMPYPMLLARSACGWSLLDGDEHDFLVEFITILNQHIRESAAREGVNYFRDGLLAFDGSRICELGRASSPAMNLIAFPPPNGDVLEALNPGIWIHNSLHPTPRGHELTASQLIPYLEKLLASDEPNPTARPAAPLEIEGIRESQPIAIDRAVFDLIQSSELQVCGRRDPGPFGTRVLLVDEPGEDSGTRRVPSFVLADADEAALICFKEGDSAWRITSPDDTDLAATEASASTGRTPIVVEEGVVSVQATVPVSGDRVYVLYTGRDGSTRLEIVEFCSRVDSCPATVTEWTETQLSRTARLAAAPIVVGILSGWFIIVGLHPRRSDDDGSEPLWRRIGRIGGAHANPEEA